jgi:hypothetical protein
MCSHSTRARLGTLAGIPGSSAGAAQILESRQNLVSVSRLAHVMIRAALHRRDRRGDAAIPGRYDNRHGRIDRAQAKSGPRSALRPRSPNWQFAGLSPLAQAPVDGSTADTKASGFSHGIVPGYVTPGIG